MILRLCLMALICLWVSETQAQRSVTVSGTVVDNENGEALPGVNVFLNNTSFKGQTDLDGRFQFSAGPGNFELIVHQQGYRTYLLPLKTDTLKAPLRIDLRPLSFEIPALTVASERAPEWYDNLILFKEAFLGTTANASQCTIDNEEQLVLDLDRVRGTLKASARAPIQITNRRLGYRIAFVLEDFALDIRRNVVEYNGYTSFAELARKSVYQKRREKAYQGSIQHWLKSMLLGTSVDDGFRSYAISRTYNPEKPSADTLRQIQRSVAAFRAGSGEKVSLRQRELLSKANLPDSIDLVAKKMWHYWEALAIDEEGATLQAPLRLRVVYLEEPPSALYRQQTHVYREEQTSHVEVKQTVRIYPDGHYSPTTALLFTGYMAWERVGDMLPINFEPVSQGKETPR
ncbi:MAG: carboxypeptidase-like regulatory domain-containing protein, partial [Bacteroidota bacterium]